MRGTPITAFLLLAVLASGLAARAALPGDDQRGLTSGDQIPTPTKPEIFDRILSELHRKRQFNGVVLVAENGEVIFKRAYGLADFEKELPLTASSSFNLASVSKPFTAMCIMILENRGKLRFDDRVAKHLPGFPYEGVTIRHLLNHTSGLPEYTDLFGEHGSDSSGFVTNELVLDALKERKPSLQFTPGARCEYSNLGYVLLASVVEKVSGTSFPTFLRRHVCEKLGLSHTFEYSEMSSEGRTPEVLGYTFRPDGQIEREDPVEDHTMGSSYIYSSAEDLFRFDQALHAAGLVTRSTLDQALAPERLSDGGSSDYGFGWEIGRGGDLLLHSGGDPGIRTLIVRYVRTTSTLIILENHTNGDFSRIAGALMNVMSGKPYKLPEKKIVFKMDPRRYDAFVGEYRLEPGFSITITRRGDRLFARGTGQQEFEIFPESETTFFYTLIEAKLSFVRDDRGEVAELVLHQGDGESRGRKIPQER